ncbi:MAG: hypothetical protein NTZ68_02520 [Candidatus Dependentiae bacterium]|nr:hypothetical protein [Candidatus Dependentiae bacterium]
MKKLMLSITLVACLSASFANAVYVEFGGFFPFQQPRYQRAVLVMHGRCRYGRHMCRNCRLGRSHRCYKAQVCEKVYYVAPIYTPYVAVAGYWNPFY